MFPSLLYLFYAGDLRLRLRNGGLLHRHRSARDRDRETVALVFRECDQRVMALTKSAASAASTTEDD
jgi:hypothetical protein